MRIKPKQYAEVLYELAEGKSGDELNSIIESFVAMLAKRGDLKHWQRIIESFSKIYNQEKGIAEIKVSSSFKLSDKIKEQLKKQLLHSELSQNRKDIDLIENIDESLIGGIRLESEDKIIDDSLNHRIENLKSQMAGS